MTRRMTLLLLLALLPVGAAAQEGDPGRRIAAARLEARAAGLPVTLLDSKVAEGQAKGVPADRIAAAVERRLGSLVRAREVMGARVAAADLGVGADALEGGVEPEALRTLAGSAPAQQRAVAIAVLTQLVRDGEASGRALARVQAALARGPEALRSLPAQAAAARGAVGPPGRGVGRGNARGRGNAGPPATIPGPGEKPERGGGKGQGRGNGNGGGNGS